MWKPLNEKNLNALTEDDSSRIIVARDTKGRCCVGEVVAYDSRNATVQNGPYSTTLWYRDMRMFVMLDPPPIPEVRVADPQLQLK